MTHEQERDDRAIIAHIRANADDPRQLDPRTLRDLADLAERALDRLAEHQEAASTLLSVLHDAEAVLVPLIRLRGE